jgi:hypothetical protein
MRLKAKLLVIFAFSARLPLVAIAATRLYYLHQRINGDSCKNHPTDHTQQPRCTTSTDKHTDTFEYIVATQWQIGYAIMSSTITGMGPFLKPFDKEYTTSYKHGSSHPSIHPTSSILPPRRNSADNVSESYLMETLPSRRASAQESEREQGRSSPLMTTDEHFRPSHMYRGHEAEVWVGDRSMSIGKDEIVHTHNKNDTGNGPKLVIGKKKEFKVEVDRASCVI